MNPIDPLAVGTIEIFLTRILLAAVVYRIHGTDGPKFATQPRPVGIARLVDLTFLARPRAHRVASVIVTGCLVLYALGIGLLPVTLVIFSFILVRGTLNNSQGALGHSTQTLAAVFMVQVAAHGIELVAGRLDPEFVFTGGAGADQLAVSWSRQAIIAVYFTSGLTKFLKSGFGWIRNAPRFALTVATAAQESYYSRLDPACRDRAEGIMRAIRQHPFLTRLLFVGALFLEMGSPLFLLGRPLAFAGGCSLIAFHRVNLHYLGLKFKINQALIASFFIVPPVVATLAAALL